ncbi:MAG: DUF362 domain-containing protein [candidate division WOR-3 bacterium]
MYTIFEEADYIINIPSLKGHLHAGMTLFAKNHFGSNTRGGAYHLHPGLIAPYGPLTRPGYGRYRVLVDLLSHEMIGGKELFYLADALWSTSYELNNPNKWHMQPFNGDWCSSIFLSQDPIAIASVGFDFLREEFQVNKAPTDTSAERFTYVQMNGTDDYLHQAADSANWTDSIPYYDPEGDGTPIPWSLGVHEHWNNPIDKQYSRNLGYNEGIELIKVFRSSIIFSALNDYSFMVKSIISNNRFELEYTLPEQADVILSVYDITGKVISRISKVKQPGVYTENKNMYGKPTGVYFIRMEANDSRFIETRKVLLVE